MYYTLQLISQTDESRNEGLQSDLSSNFGVQRFQIYMAVKQEVGAWLRKLGMQFFKEGIKKLFSHYSKCINKAGDFVKK